MFIGRKRELEFLREHYQSKEGELIVLYGRRRIGKTETLNQFRKDRMSLFFSCTESPDAVQLQNFSNQILSLNPALRNLIPAFPTWEAAFRSLADLPFGDQKKLVIIDEFPYMCRVNPAIPSILQMVWDTVLKDQNIMLILCGSAMSFIEKEILSSKNPLYGRATGIYKMGQLGFYDAAKFFPDYSSQDIVTAYAILGGIPFYLKQFDPEKSVSENIEKGILEKGTPLYSETEFLIRQELREPAVYNSIITAIAAGATRLSDISSKAGLSNTGQTSVYLKNLIDLGIVNHVFSVDTGKKEKSNRSRGTYELADSFFRFWYRYAWPNYTQLEGGQQNLLNTYLIQPDLNKFASLAFEDICKEYFQLLNSSEKLSCWFSKVGHWRGKTTVRNSGSDTTRTEETEIDLMAVSPAGDHILIGECKFKASPFQYSEYLNTRAKLLSHQMNSHFEYMLFSLSGFDEELHKEAEKNPDLTLVSLEEIVHPSFLKEKN